MTLVFALFIVAMFVLILLSVFGIASLIDRKPIPTLNFVWFAAMGTYVIWYVWLRR